MQNKKSVATFVWKCVLTVTSYLLVAAFSQAVLAQHFDFGREERSNTGRRYISRATRITLPGSYVLTNNINVSGGDAAIRINASGVTLDLNGYHIETSAAGTGRGILVENASGVTIKNGRVGGFLANVMVMNATNVTVQDLQILGAGLAPNNGPSEIGINLINVRAALIKGNRISSVNLGIFVRGGGSTGNRITENTVVGGANPAFALLGICYNPAPTGGTDGPRGDLIYNNHIVRFGYAFALSEFSLYNIIRDNTFASFNAGIRETQLLSVNGGTNVAEDNIEVTIPATVLQ